MHAQKKTYAWYAYEPGFVFCGKCIDMHDDKHTFLVVLALDLVISYYLKSLVYALGNGWDRHVRFRR